VRVYVDPITHVVDVEILEIDSCGQRRRVLGGANFEWQDMDRITAELSDYAREVALAMSAGTGAHLNLDGRKETSMTQVDLPPGPRRLRASKADIREELRK